MFGVGGFFFQWSRIDIKLFGEPLLLPHDMHSYVELIQKLKYQWDELIYKKSFGNFAKNASPFNEIIKRPP